MNRFLKSMLCLSAGLIVSSSNAALVPSSPEAEDAENIRRAGAVLGKIGQDVREIVNEVAGLDGVLRPLIATLGLPANTPLRSVLETVLDLPSLPKPMIDDELFVVAGHDGSMRLNLQLVDSGTTWALRGIAYGFKLFVAVGDYGKFATSPNGVNWTQRFSGIGANLSGVAWGMECFVIVGVEGVILTSPNGKDCTQQNSGTTKHLNGVVFGEGLWVAVGQGGTILTSLNYIDWPQQNSHIDHDLFGVCYGNGIYVAIGAKNAIAISQNGFEWREIFLNDMDPESWLYGIAYGNEWFVAVGNEQIIFSQDGSDWSQLWLREYFRARQHHRLNGVAFNGRRFVAVGDDGAIFDIENRTHCMRRPCLDPATSFTAIAFGKK
ncbi:MAG: hypothetical protein LBL30_00915 [Holosporales bacterium]|jgi:hypothetical protein|nr:hypothetical protein [Holosporales bacterium]